MRPNDFLSTEPKVTEDALSCHHFGFTWWKFETIIKLIF